MGTRLVTLELAGKVQEIYHHVSRLNELEFGSKNWTVYHVKLGEMQGVQAVTNVVIEMVNQKWEDKKWNAPPEYNMRDNACPDEYSKFLLKERERGFADL